MGCMCPPKQKPDSRKSSYAESTGEPMSHNHPTIDRDEISIALARLSKVGIGENHEGMKKLVNE